MTTFKDARSGAAITVKVTPKAKKTGVAGVLEDGTLKIQVTAPAEDGRANAALVEFLAEALGIRANQVEIVAGLSSERKLVSLVGVTPAEVEAKLVPRKKESGLKRAAQAVSKRVSKK